MSNTAFCQFLRIFSGSSTQYLAQNFFVGQTVDGYPFAPFAVANLTASSSVKQSGVSVVLPYSLTDLNLFTTAFRSGWIVAVAMNQFTPTATGLPPGSFTLVARYVGEIIRVDNTLSEITLELGSSLDPIGAQVPPRKFTTTLVGTPPRL